MDKFNNIWQRAISRQLFRKKQRINEAPRIRVFDIDGERYYRLKNFEHLPVNRADQIDAIIKNEAMYNLSRDDMGKALQRLHNELEGADGVVHVGNARKLIYELQKAMMLFTPGETTYKIAAVAFFTQGEDITERVPLAEIKRRAELFKKKDALSDVLATPVGTMLGFEKRLLNSLDSRLSLVQKIKDQEPILAYIREVVTASESET